MLIALLLSAASPDPDALFAEVARKDTPGCAVDVRRGNTILAQRRYGMANLETPEPISMETVFEAGSVSKQMTGALVALLAERRTLSFDDSVRRWLPELPKLYQPVTIDMLLHHTSGIRDWGVLTELTGWPRGTRAYSMDDAVALIAGQRALNFSPGSEYLYSNSNYLLAARIVERATGRPFAQVAASELFAPLGLAQTGWRSDFRDVVPRRAQAYTPGAQGAWQLDMPFEDVVGPGGLLTTVGDLQRWNTALDSPSIGWARRMIEPGRLADGTRVPYSLGLDLGPLDGRAAISHAGSTAGYRAWLGRFPADGLSVALLCNAGSLNTEDLGPQLAALFLPPAATARPAPAPAAAAAVPADVPGAYRNPATDTLVKVIATEASLRVGGSSYAMISEDLFATQDGRRLRVSRDRKGAIQSLDLARPGNVLVRLETAKMWNPDESALAKIAGCYRSAEIEGEHCLLMREGELRWRDPRGTLQRLTPTISDTFSAPGTGWTLRIVRENGAVSGLRFSIARARRVFFRRIATQW